MTTSSEEANFLRDVCTQDAWEYYIDFAKNNYGSTPSVKITAERFTAFNASLYKANVVVIDGIFLLITALWKRVKLISSSCRGYARSNG